MQYLQLATVPVDQNDDNLILLVEPTTLDQLDAVLQPTEMIFLRQSVAKGVRAFFFPQANNAVFVRVLEPASDVAPGLEEARLDATKLLCELKNYHVESAIVRTFCPEERALAFLEGLMLGSYQFVNYFSDPSKKSKQLTSLRWAEAHVPQTAVNELNSLVQAVFMTRDMVNEPHSHFDALKLADVALEAGKVFGFSVEVLGKEKIEELKMGGLLAVNQASTIPPQFCILEWRPESPRNKKPVVLIGKGVVYDTGGLSLKSPDGMENMKCDMAGAAAVIGTLSAIAQSNMPIHVIGLIPATDNKVGDRALSPGDVIRMYSGTTVEVVNTDAEGRLILADAMHYAKQFEPDLVLDLATLTGAAVRALGSQAICYMGTADAKVKRALETSGWNTYERLVELPLWKEYGDELKSSIADLKNMGNGPAGMITAGKFLEHFADYPWLHLDIAGSAYLRAANGYRPKEGTGVGVRLLFDFLKKWGAEE
ncbi:MAG: leucyl aminopeptidase [Lewinellaceae bacterium]|nr:leucyl aminopeptidase [Saprospiraceae bacterium]MCB9332754.1 leucyl aminopeptidase [Lewinellaceae bacterium]